MKSIGWWILVFLSFFCIGVLIFSQEYKKYRAKKNGYITLVEVVSAPSFCLGKHNRIGVTIKGERFVLEISRKSCVTGEYYVGKKIKVIYDAKTKVVLFPEKNTELSLIISIFPFICPFIFYYMIQYLLRQKEEEARKKQRKKKRS